MTKKSYFKILLALVMTTLVTFPAFGKSNANPQFLVSGQALKENLQTSQIVVIDVRGHVEYDEGHLQGAINIPIASLFTAGARPDLVISLNEAMTIFSNAGIGRRTEVVIYDNGGFIDAARAFWVLEIYGHERLALLDGGYPAWMKNNFPVSTAKTVPTVRQFIPTVTPDRLSTKLSVRLAIDESETAIIDARREIEYTGKESKSSRYGHIPNAVNVPSKKNFEVVGTVTRLRSDEELNTLYSPISNKSNVIAYCNKGKESALTYFVLRKLGFNVSAYDGSWHEWGNDTNLPIEK